MRNLSAVAMQIPYDCEAMNLVYDTMDDLLCENKFAECNSILQETDISSTSIDILVALLIITAAAKSRIPYRSEFLNKVSDELINRGESEKERDVILAGL